jgi:predicted alpha/beta hydrolase family esterase
MKFILFHGAFGNPNENWLPMLASKLREVGQEVVIPAFPVDDWDEMVKNGPTVELEHQSLDHWLQAFEDVVKNIDPKEKLCFVGHSLGCVFILHAVEKFGLQLDSAIFVSPFLDTLDRWEFNLANHTFYKTDFDFENLKKRIPVSYAVYSDTDPYVSNDRSIHFGHAVSSSIIMVKGAGHFNGSVNLTKFPLVTDLCLTRIDLSLYQNTF